MVDLVIRDCRLRILAEDTIDRAVVITLVVQLGLDICDHLVRRQIIVAVDRTIVGIIRVRIISPARIPIARIKEEWERLRIDGNENDSVAVVPPPTAIVPLRLIIAECPILSSLKCGTFPVMGKTCTRPVPKRRASGSVHERIAAFLKARVCPMIIERLARRWPGRSITPQRPFHQRIVRAQSFSKIRVCLTIVGP